MVAHSMQHAAHMHRRRWRRTPPADWSAGCQRCLPRYAAGWLSACGCAAATPCHRGRLQRVRHKPGFNTTQSAANLHFKKMYSLPVSRPVATRRHTCGYEHRRVLPGPARRLPHIVQGAVWVHPLEALQGVRIAIVATPCMSLGRKHILGWDDSYAVSPNTGAQADKQVQVQVGNRIIMDNAQGITFFVKIAPSDSQL
jgi:hypothetical protein